MYKFLKAGELMELEDEVNAVSAAYELHSFSYYPGGYFYAVLKRRSA